MTDKGVQKLSDELDGLGIKYEIIRHPPIRTVEAGLQFLGIEAKDGISTLILLADETPLAVVRRDDNHLDLEKIKALVGAKHVRLANKQEVLKISGFPVGATPVLTGLETLMDKTILEREFVYGGTGSFEHDVKIKPADLQRATKAKEADIIVAGFAGGGGLRNAVVEQLRKAGIKSELLELPVLPDAIEAHVKYHGIEMKEAVPTLIYKTEKGNIAVQRRADTKIDDRKLKNLVGVKRLSLVSAGELRSLGSEPGAVPLTGMNLPYFVDQKVLELGLAYCGGGDKRTAMKILPGDLVRVNKAKIGDFSEFDFEIAGTKKRILTGDTPTGKLHLGHYVGTLENRVRLQNDYDTFIILADLHSFTTLSEYPEKVRDSTYQVALDNLAVGLDPKKVHIFIESQIPEIYELAAIYSMLVSHNRAMRNPTIKDEIKMKGLGDKYSLGFINYPLFQAADITCVGAQLVPVGKDQLPHIEQTREIVERFNQLYEPVLVKPEGLVGKVGKLVGTDGSPKMSKSLGNTIMLSDPPEVVKERVMNMFTDPTRIHQNDPGHVEGNPVFMYHDAFNKDKGEVEELKRRYKTGAVGDIEVKERLVKVLNDFLDPIRERRGYYEKHPDEVQDILSEGTKATRAEAQKTLEGVRKAMKMDYNF